MTQLQFPLLTLQIVATFCTSEYFRFLFHQFIGSFFSLRWKLCIKRQWHVLSLHRGKYNQGYSTIQSCSMCATNIRALKSMTLIQLQFRKTQHIHQTTTNINKHYITHCVEIDLDLQNCASVMEQFTRSGATLRNWKREIKKHTWNPNSLNSWICFNSLSYDFM